MISDEQLIAWLAEYGYIILFVWSLMEGEMGLIIAGMMAHKGEMDIGLSIIIAAIGGFLGDQFYFYIGRYNKNYIYKKFKTQRRKFAMAHLLLKRYGWPVIFIQRYLYGLRAIIPMSIGVTRYSAKMFAIINFISAIIWATTGILLAYIFGEPIWRAVKWIKDHYYIAIPIAITIGGSIYLYLHYATKRK